MLGQDTYFVHAAYRVREKLEEARSFCDRKKRLAICKVLVLLIKVVSLF